MSTISEQLAAEAKRRNLQTEQEAAVQAQPGPTVDKAALEHSQKIEMLKRAILASQAQSGGKLLDAPVFEHGATLGLDVPLSGLASGLNFFGGDGSTFSERYEAGEAARRAELDRAKAETYLPKTQELSGSLLSLGPAGSADRFAVEQAGGTVLPAARTSFLRAAGEGAGVGAGSGAIHGAATGEGDWRDRLLQGGKEAAVGGVAGSLLGTAARAIQPDTGPAIARVAAADEFGIPLTRGQATGDIAQQKTEQELIHGAKGPGPQQAMATHQSLLDTARGNAVEDIRTRFSPFGGGDAQASGQLLAEGLRRRAERLRTVGGGRIEEALNSGAEVDAQHLRELPDRLTTALQGPNPQVPEHYLGVNTPMAAEAMQRVQDFARHVPDDPTAMVSLAGVNQLRRNLLALQGANGNDARALTAIKREVDNWITDIAGADPALAELRRGNDLYRRGSDIVEPRGREVTPAQKNVAKLANPNAIGEDAVRIFKVDQRGGVGAEAARTAQQISTTMGANSPAMQRVRDIALTSLLDGGPQRVSNQIDNFLRSSRTTAEAMFTPDQIAELERFRDATRSLVPDPAATNPSKSSYGVMKTVLRNALVGAGALLGHQSGMGVEGTLGSMVVGGGVGRGAESLLGTMATGRALRPIPGGQHYTAAAQDVAKTVPAATPDRETLARLLHRGPM